MIEHSLSTRDRERFFALVEQYRAAGFVLGDNRQDSATRFAVRKSNRTVYECGDVQALADWLDG